MFIKENPDIKQNSFKRFSALVYNAEFIKFLFIMNVARQRNVNGCENMSRQQLENIFAMLSAFIPTAIPISTSKFRPRPAIKLSSSPILRPRRTPEPLPVDMEKFQEMEMEKVRSVPGNAW